MEAVVWLEIIERFGVPAAFMALLAWFIYKQFLPAIYEALDRRERPSQWQIVARLVQQQGVKKVTVADVLKYHAEQDEIAARRKGN